MFLITETEAYLLSWSDHNFLQRELSTAQHYSKGALWSYSVLLAVMDMNQIPATKSKFRFKFTAVALYWTRSTLQVCIPLHFTRPWSGFWNTALEQIRFHGPGTAFSRSWHSLFYSPCGFLRLVTWIPLLVILLVHFFVRDLIEGTNSGSLLQEKPVLQPFTSYTPRQCSAILASWPQHNGFCFSLQQPFTTMKWCQHGANYKGDPWYFE